MIKFLLPRLATLLGFGLVFISWAYSDDNHTSVIANSELIVADAGLDSVGQACNSETAFDLSTFLRGADAGGSWVYESGLVVPISGSEINLTSVVMSDTIFYIYISPDMGMGPDTSDISVEVILAPDAGSDGSADACNSDNAFDVAALLSGADPGGTWEAATGTSTSISIAGIVDLTSTAMTDVLSYWYIVTGTSPCANDTAQFDVTVNIQPNVGADNMDDVCNSNNAYDVSALILGDNTGGTWSQVNGTATAISAAGIVDLTSLTSTETLIYRYTISGTSPCIDDEADFDITVIIQPNAGSDGSADACNSDNAFDVSTLLSGEDPGGIWSQFSGTATAISAAGIVDLTSLTSTETLTYRYTVVGTSPCVDDEADFDITVNIQPNAGSDNNDDACTTDDAYDLSLLLSGADGGGSWEVDPASTSVPISVSSADFTSLIADEIILFHYIVSGTSPCINDTAEFSISVRLAPEAGNDGSANACNTDAGFDVSTLLSGGDGGGSWGQSAGTTTAITAAGVVDLTALIATETLTYIYYVMGMDACLNDTASFDITVNIQPNAGSDNTDDACTTEGAFDLSLLLSMDADGGGSWEVDPGSTSVPISVSSADFTSLIADEIILFYYIVSGSSPCINDTADFSISVRLAPEAGDDGSADACNIDAAFDVSTLLSGADGGGSWDQFAGTTTAISVAGVVDLTGLTVSETLTYIYYVMGMDACLDDTASFDITVNIQPDAGSDSTADVCNSNNDYDLSSLLSVDADAGGLWSVSSGTAVPISVISADFTGILSSEVITFEYEVAGVSPCVDDIASFDVTVNIQPDAGDDNLDAVICGNVTVYDLTSLLSTSDFSGDWLQTGGTAVDITDPNSVDFTNLLSSTTLSFDYTLTALSPCITDGSSHTISVTIQTDLKCEGQINTTVGVNCDAQFTAEELLVTNIIAQPGPYQITIGNAVGIDTVVLGSDYINTNLQFVVLNLCSGISCWGDLKIQDKSVPDLNCTNLTVDCDVSLSPSSTGYPIPANVNASIQSIGGKCYTVSNWDNCSDVTLCYVDREESLNCDPVLCKRIKRTWTVTDPDIYQGYPNSKTCTQYIGIRLPQSNDFTPPPNFELPNNAISCSDLNNNGIPDRTEDLNHNNVPDREEGELFGVTTETSVEVRDGHTNPGVPTPDVTGWPSNGSCLDCVIPHWDDHIIEETCSRYIERTWHIIDWCSTQNVDITFVQKIKIIDDEKPELIYCSHDITMYVGNHDCSTSGELPKPQVHDGCTDHGGSTNLTYTATASIGNVIWQNGKAYLDIDLSGQSYGYAESYITWTIKDPCGNSLSCHYWVNVYDNTPPTASCHSSIEVSLTTSGYAKLWATDGLNSGSNDNCGNVYFKVIRKDDLHVDSGAHGSHGSKWDFACEGVNGDDDTHNNTYDVYFDDFVKFCCEDVGNTVRVVLRVYDYLPYNLIHGPIDPLHHGHNGSLYNHYNECYVDVKVRDALNNTSCPPDKWVYCNQEIPYDIPVGSTICEDLDVIPVDTIYDLDACGLGTITRKWRIDTDGWNNYTCEQVIKIKASNKYFFINDTDCTNKDKKDGVEWPCNIYDLPCTTTVDDLTPEELDSEPIIVDDVGDCPNVFLGFEDLVLYDVDGVCLKVLRTWTVVDWCGRLVNGLKPRWDYEQLIKVEDDVKPEVMVDVNSSCDSTDGCSFWVVADADASDNCTDAMDLSYRYKLSNRDSGNGPSFRGFLAPGDYSITFYVTDGCGNERKVEKSFEVVDCKVPVIICNVGIGTVVMPSTGTVEVQAESFDGGSKDDCSDVTFDIRRSTEDGETPDTWEPSIIFSCEDLQGMSSIEISIDLLATDENGNSAYCTTFVTLQDNESVCEIDPLTCQTLYGLTTQGDLYAIDAESGDLVMINNFDTSGSFNALSVNSDLGLAYFASSLTLYWYDIANGEEGLVGVLDIPGILSNGSGAYANGHVYLGTENATGGGIIDIYRVALSTDGKSFDGAAENITNGLVPGTTDFGDIVVEDGTTDQELILISALDLVTRINDLSRFDVAAQSIESLLTFDGPSTAQITRDAAGNFWLFENSTNELSIFDIETGERTGTRNIGFSLSDLGQAWCSVTPFVTTQLSGRLTTEYDEPVSVHKIKVMSNGNLNDPQAVVEGFSTGEGYFAFADLNGGSFVSPYNNDDAINGVNSQDLIGILRYMYGIEQFDSPYKMIAADVSDDRVINALDLNQIQNLILGKTTVYPQNLSWRYVGKHEDMSFANPYSFEEPLNILQMSTQERLNADFVAVKIGDVNNSAIIDTHEPEELSLRSGLELLASQNIGKTENDLRIDITSSNFNDIEGYQFTLGYDKDEASLKRIESGAIQVHEESFAKHTVSGRDYLTMSWYTLQSKSVPQDEVLFTLVMEGSSINSFVMNSDITKAESYKDGRVNGIHLDFASYHTSSSFALYQNRPNPFENVTLISYDLPSKAEVDLTIYDVTGKVIMKDHMAGQKGYNEWKLRLEDLEGKLGVYYYNIATDSFNATKKMIAF